MGGVGETPSFSERLGLTRSGSVLGHSRKFSVNQTVIRKHNRLLQYFFLVPDQPEGDEALMAGMDSGLVC